MVQNVTVGRIDHRYEIRSQIGAGGMGLVFRAHDRLTGQDVALKRVYMRPEEGASRSRAGLLALAHEFQASAALRHPQIVRVLDYGFDDLRQPYLTMELLESPDTLVQAAAGLNAVERLKLLVQALHALLYLHRRGVLHRDIKPANILVVNGMVKLVDFGLASVRPQDEEMAGTIGYMAPEILQGEPPSEASDLFAVGVVAYELLTGEHPYKAQSEHVFSVMQRMLNTVPDLTPLLHLHNAGMFTTSSSPLTEPPETDQPDTVIFDDLHPPHSVVVDALPVDDARTIALDAFPTVRASALAADDAATLLFSAAKLSPPPPTRSARTRSDTAEPIQDVPTVPGVISRLLARSPNDRYSDAADVIRDLSQAIGAFLPVETADTRESFLQAASFVGREKELARLEEALSRAITGEGGLWFVSGESGAGKSRLLDELRIRALTQGALVARGQAAENGAAYLAWRDPLKRLLLNVEVQQGEAGVLADLLPDLADLLGRTVQVAPPLEPDEAINRLIVTVNGILRRQTRPIVILLEDVHWMTRESLALMEALGVLADRLPLLIVASLRSDELNSGLEPLIDQARTISLRRLARAEIAQLAASMVGERATHEAVVTLLERETEGNIFFIVEVVRVLAEEAGQLDEIGSRTLPATLFVRGMQQVIERRLARLAPQHYPLLGLAAVIGRVIDRAPLAASGAGDLEAWLYACERAHILEAREDSWQFAHDKIREGVLTALDADGRAILHRRAAHAIQAAYPGVKGYAAALAYHWQQAGDSAQERIARVAAGQHAYQTGGFDAAISHYQRALDLFAPDRGTAAGDRATASVLLELARLYSRLGDRTGCDTRMGEASQIATALHDRALLGQVAVYRGRLALADGEIDAASRHFRQALDVTTDAPDVLLRAETMTLLARSLSAGGHYAEAEPLLHEALTLYRAAEAHNYGLGHTLYALAEVLMGQGDLDRAEGYFREALAISRAINDRNSEAASLMQIGLTAFYRGQADPARDALSTALEKFEAIDDQYGIASCANNLGFLAFSDGDLASAEGYFARSLEISESFGDRWGEANTLTNLGHVAGARGDAAAACGLYMRGLSLAVEIGAAAIIMETLVALAPALIGRARPDLALAAVTLAASHPASAPDVRDRAAAMLPTLDGTPANFSPRDLVTAALAALS